VEKILRVQPKVKKLYLLLRAVDTKSAEERLHNEVKSSSSFFLFFFILNLLYVHHGLKHRIVLDTILYIY